MSKEFTPCETCPINKYRESAEEVHVSNESLERAIELAGSMGSNATQAATLSYMALRHEAPEAPAEEVQAALRSVTAIVYPGGAGCETWRYDEESQEIVPAERNEEI